MKQILLTMGVISAMVLTVVCGFWLIELRLSPTVSPSTVAPVRSGPPLSQPVANAAIRRHISIVMAMRPRVVTQWDGVAHNMDFSPDGRWLAQSIEAGVEIKRTSNWKRFRLFKDVGRALDFSGDSELLAVQNRGIWRMDDGRLISRVSGGNDSLGPISLSPDSRFFATLAWPEAMTSQGPSMYPVWVAKELRVYELSRPRLQKLHPGLDSDDNGFSTIFWRDVAKSGKSPVWKAELMPGHGDVTRVADHAISVNMANRAIESSDATTGELLSRAKRLSKIGPIAVAPDATLFAAADAADPFVYIWRLPDGKLLGTIKRQNARQAMSLAFSSDAKQLAVSFLTDPTPPDYPTVAPKGSTVIYQLNATRDK